MTQSAGETDEAAPAPDTVDLVVIGASAGGVETLGRLMARLDGRLEVAALIVLHIAPTATSVLPSVLARSAHVPVLHARDGQAIEPGQILVAPPDHHLEVDGKSVRLHRGPRVNGVRPAVDALFQSAAAHFGPRVMGIVLSGMLDDGTTGLAAIKRAGGITAAQDPSEAAYPQMPNSAITAGVVDHVLGVEQLADLVASAKAPTTSPLVFADDPQETDMEGARPAAEDQATGISCPSCGGVLSEQDEDGGPSFRCRVGHAFSSASLFEAQTGSLDLALWAGVRALEERAALARRLNRRMRDRGQTRLALRYERLVSEADAQAEVIKRVITAARPEDVVDQAERERDAGRL